MILQLAVQGKLEAQNKNEGTGLDIFVRNQKVRNDLINSGSIKKPKQLPSITESEIPFLIPDSWHWCRLGDVTNYGYSDKAETSNLNDDTWVLELADVEKITSRLLKKVRFKEKKSKSTKSRFKASNVIYGKLRPYLDKVIVADEDGVCTTEMIPVFGYFGISPSYLRWILKSPYFIEYANQSTHGMNLPRLGTDKARLATIPIPPLQEQKRIVTKVDQLMALCDELDSKLSQSQSDCDKLLAAIVSSIENVSSKKIPKNRNTKTISKKIEPNKTSPIGEHINTPEKKGASTSKPQTNTEKLGKKFDKLEVLKAFRKAIFRQNDIDELTLLRLVGQRLDIKRLSQPIHHELESHINTAIRRKILYRDGDGYSAVAPTIEHYNDDFLIKVLRSVSRKGWEYQRQHLVEKSAKYLGFDKASDAFKERMKSVFRKATRQKALYRKGAYFGKV